MNPEGQGIDGRSGALTRKAPLHPGPSGTLTRRTPSGSPTPCPLPWTQPGQPLPRARRSKSASFAAGGAAGAVWAGFHTLAVGGLGLGV